MAGRDRDAFAEFVAARSGSLHRAAYLMVGDAGLAQDLVQEALTKTYVAWPRLRDPANAEAYTRKAITTTAITWFRRRSFGERPSAHVPDRVLVGHADVVAERSWLRDALLELPPRQRAAVVLRHYEDLSEAETAAAMGCAVGTVKSQAAAGLAKLRQRLRDESALLPEFAPVDVAAVSADADRRVRRRAVTTVTAVVVLVVGVAVVLSGLRGESRVEPAPPVPVPPTWAAGTTIHDGDGELEVGRRVDAFVRTSVGFVVASRGEVWSVVGEVVTRVGSIGRYPTLVGDDEGSLVVWQEPGDDRGLRVLDQTGGSPRRLQHTAPLFELVALDGTSAYVRTRQGSLVLDVRTGEPVPSPAQGSVVDAEDGVTVVDLGDDVRVESARGGGHSLGDVDVRVADLSPNARWLAVPSAGASVYDVAAGSWLDLRVEGQFVLPYGWSGPETALLLVGDDANSAARIMACPVPDGACTVEAQLPPFAQDTEAFDVQLPTGRPLAAF